MATMIWDRRSTTLSMVEANTEYEREMAKAAILAASKRMFLWESGGNVIHYKLMQGCMAGRSSLTQPKRHSFQCGLDVRSRLEVHL